MTVDYLTSLGFPGDWDATIDAITSSRIQALTGIAGYNRLYVYDDPSGATIALIETDDGQRTETCTVHAGVNPERNVGPTHSRGTVPGGGHTAEIFQVSPGTVHVDLFDEEGHMLTRVLAFVDDPHMYPTYPLDGVGKPALYDDFHLGAIAVDMAIFDDEEQWAATREPMHGPDGEPDLLIGPRFVSSPWLFALYAGDATAEEASPISMVKAVCENVELVRNELTGMPWYRVLADCGFDIILALPADATPEPKPGSVIDGTALLTGSTGFWRVG